MHVPTFLRGNLQRVLLSTVGCAALLLMGGASVTGSGSWQVGDLVVCVGSGQCRIYTSPTDFTTISVLNNPKKETGEPAWSSAFALYVVDARNQKVHLFSKTDPHTVLQTIDTSANSSGLPGPLVVDSAGNLYVGMTNGDILKYDRHGSFLAPTTVATENGGGVNWMALADDHQHLYYTSSGLSLQRINLGDLDSDVWTLGGGAAAGLRILPVAQPLDPDETPVVDGSGGILVADGVNIKKVSVVEGQTTATVDKTYDAPDEDAWRAVTLHPDGKQFSALTAGGKIYSFELEGLGQPSGPVINTGSTDGSGLTFKGGPQPNIRAVHFTAGTTAVADAVKLAVFGNPVAGPTEAFPRHAFGILIPSLPAGSDALVVVSANWAKSDEVCPSVGETVATDYDCRAAANFVPTPRCIPYVSDSQTDCVFYRLEDDDLTVPTSLTDSLIKFIDFRNPANGYEPDGCTGSPKGNPRMLFVEEHGAAFTDDITVGITQTESDPIFGGGTGRGGSDYGAFDRCLGEAGGAIAQIVKPVGGSSSKSGSSIPFDVSVNRGGVDVPNAVAPPNNMSLLVRNNDTGATFLEPQPTPGSSPSFFTAVTVKVNRTTTRTAYRANWDTNGKIPGSYTGCVTSIAQPDGTGEFQDLAGLFAPVCVTFTIK